MYKFQTKVRFNYTDAAGIIFFSNIFVLAHECYESFIDQTKTFASFLMDGEYTAPIVHAEADYLVPIGPSEILDIEMTLNKMGTSSFEVDYKIINEKNETAAKAKTIHVALDAKSREPVEIPKVIKDILEKL